MIKKNRVVVGNSRPHLTTNNLYSTQTSITNAEVSKQHQKQNAPLHLANNVNNDLFLFGKDRNHSLPKHAIAIINSIKEYFKQNPVSKKTAISFAEEAHFNRVQLQKWFRMSVGMGIKEYSDHQRLELAKRLLEEGSKSVKQISAICKYKSQAYFTRAFKKKYNVTPTRWKDQNS